MDALFDETDFCTLLLPTLIMLYLGQYCVKSAPTAEVWGKRIASVVFLLILGTELLAGEFSDPMMIAGTTVSALLIAGMVLGLSWTVLPLPLSLFEQTVGEGFGQLSRWKRKQQQRRDEKQYEKERLERQRQSEAEWEQNAPKRERQQLEKQQLVKSQAETATPPRRSSAPLPIAVRSTCSLICEKNCHQNDWKPIFSNIFLTSIPQR